MRSEAALQLKHFSDFKINSLEKAKQQLAQQQLANQNQPQQQVTMKPAVQDPTDDAKRKQAIEQLGLAPIIETNQLAATSHLKAERAFRSGDYGQAARFAGLAKSLDESNGKLLLFATQAHFANGEYGESVDALSKANSILPPAEMAWVVNNFKLFYGQNDFVTQMKSLSAHLKQSPNDASAWLLRGYQYGALGYPDAATKDFDRAKELGGDSALIDSLMERFANAVPE
jgi:tetratricopeptide (TPR) repeat protein